MLARLRSLSRNLGRIHGERGVPVPHLLRDMWFFRKALGASQSEFFAYRLWDRSRSPAERLAYLTFADHRRIENTLNPVVEQRLLLDKITIAERFEAAGVPMPGVVGVFRAATGLPARTFATRADLEQISRGHWRHGLVIKPNDGMEGRGIMVFDMITAGAFRRLDGTVLTVDELHGILARNPDSTWKIESRLIPHSILAAVMPDVLCTVRVTSFRFRDGRVVIGPSAWKIATDRSGVDNFARGNIAAPIDITTGIVGAGATFVGDDYVEVHPGTGVRFAGLVLPHWDAVREIVARGCDVLPNLGALGWDIAITPDGPFVIEANPWWSESLLQVAHHAGMVRGEFVGLLRDYGLEELLTRRERLAKELAGTR